MDKNIFGIKVKCIREHRKLSQSKLAEIINITDAALSNLETGKSYPHINTLLSICDALDVSVVFLLSDEKDVFSKYYHKEILLNFTFTGIEGVARIKDIMKKFRASDKFNGELKRIDYAEGIEGLPKSDVLKFFLNDAWFAVRPSGTEPKLKIYIGASADNINECDEIIERVKGFINTIIV